MSPLSLSAAFEVLGLPPGTDRKSARRAYLRLLKKHKPERDPEGFQRIREAYERIAQAGDWELAHVAEREQSESDSSSEAADHVHDPLHEEYWSWGERVEAAELEEAVPLAREAVESMPRYAAAHWLLYRTLIEAGARDEAARTLREAHERGLPGFWSALVGSHGDALTDREVEELGDSVSTWQLAKILLERERVEEASTAFERVMEAARVDFQAAPPAFSVLDFILDLAIESPELARAANASWARWLEESGSRVDGWSVPTYALTRELMSLPGTFPPELFRAFAAAIRDGDPGGMHEELAEWKRKHPLSRNAATRELINRRVPNLRAAAQMHDPPRERSAREMWTQGLSLLLAFSVLSLVRNCDCGHEVEGPVEVLAQLEQLRAQSVASSACDTFGRRSPPCEVARSLSDFMRFDNCAGAYSGLAHIDEWIADKAPPERFEEAGEAVLHDIRDIVSDHCERSP